MANITGNIIFIPRYGIEGAAAVSLVSIFLSNSLNLVFMKVRLDLHPFTGRYLRNFVALSLIAVVLAWLVKLCGFSPGVRPIGVFLPACLGIMGLLAWKKFLCDATDVDVIRSFASRSRGRGE